jgi:ssDNA-binding Zn-finger/Zn-ribbon topoisomerase 1
LIVSPAQQLCTACNSNFVILVKKLAIMISCSKCPKCEKSGFEVSTESPKNSNYKVTFVRCSFCKTVVGTMEPASITNLIHQLAQKLGKPLN